MNMIRIEDEFSEATVAEKTAVYNLLTQITPQSSDSLPTDTAPTLASSAMLVELNISNWSGRKKDNRASADVTSQNYAATGVANVNKKLLADNADLKAIQTHVTAMRNMHAAMTMPWSNSGLRLLPTAQYFKYTGAMSDMENKFWGLVNAFLINYHDAVIDVQMLLGDLFSRDDYPTAEELQRKYRVHINYMPLPDAGDFRIDISNEALREVKEQYADFYTTQYNTAMNDVWTRLHEALTNMSERLDYVDTGEMETYYTKPTKTNPNGLLMSRKAGVKYFKDSLVGNVNDMVELLRVCNVTSSPQMAQMADKLEEAMAGVTPDGLREDDTFRAETKRAVDDAIKSLPSLDI